MGHVISFDRAARPAPQPNPAPRGLLHNLFGSFVGHAQPPIADDVDALVKRASILKEHLRAVHDLIEHLGPAEALSICRIGVDAAEAALKMETGK